MGAVWAATHTVTSKAVALKFLLGRGDDPALRERLLREARAVCAVMHPNVVPVHDVFELEGGAPVLVMDLLRGESLAAKLEREKTLPHEEVVRIALDVLAALEAAHARGIVHRDLKPDNIFLARNAAGTDDVKVLDFGIAKVTTLGEADAQVAALTRTDAMVGTPYYMAPEQVYGEKDIDARSDLWSMGIVMYECLAGIRPTEGANLGQIFKLVTIGPIPPLGEKAPGCPTALVKLVMGCLERTREGRPPNATALREALERVRAGSTMDGAEVLARAVDVPRETSPKRWGAIAAGILAVAAVVGGIGAATVKSRAAANRPSVTATATATAAPPPPVNAPAAVPEAPPPPPSATAPAAAPAPVASAAPTAKPKVRARPAAAPSPAGDERAAGKVVVTPPF